MNENKTCPRCGSPGELFGPMEFGAYRVYCSNQKCPESFFGNKVYTKEEAWAQWNERAEQ